MLCKRTLVHEDFVVVSPFSVLYPLRNGNNVAIPQQQCRSIQKMFHASCSLCFPQPPTAANSQTDSTSPGTSQDSNAWGLGAPLGAHWQRSCVQIGVVQREHFASIARLVTHSANHPWVDASCEPTSQPCVPHVHQTSHKVHRLGFVQGLGMHKALGDRFGNGWARFVCRYRSCGLHFRVVVQLGTPKIHQKVGCTRELLNNVRVTELVRPLRFYSPF